MLRCEMYGNEGFMYIDLMLRRLENSTIAQPRRLRALEIEDVPSPAAIDLIHKVGVIVGADQRGMRGSLKPPGPSAR
jgi:hypothetical protein